jgi:hypothetical protein
MSSAITWLGKGRSRYTGLSARSLHRGTPLADPAGRTARSSLSLRTISTHTPACSYSVAEAIESRRRFLSILCSYEINNAPHFQYRNGTIDGSKR